MGRIVRFSGIGAFLALVLALVLAGFLWADNAFKNSVEIAGTEIVGARVELQGAAISFLDQAIELRGLAVANPDKPMTNLLQVDRIQFDFAPGALLRRRLHVDSMVMTGLQLGTPRQRSGAIDGRRVAELADLRGLLPSPTLPSFELPSPQEAIANEQLETLALIDEIDRDMENKLRHIREEIDRLPTAAELAEYEARLKALKSKNYNPLALLAKSDEIKSLRGAFKSAVARVKALRKEIAATKTYLHEKIADAKKMPRTDIERIKQKYSLSGAWVEGLTAQVFGREIAGWVDRGWLWFKTLEPYLGRVAGADGSAPRAPAPPSRGRGVNITFPEINPTPDLLVRHILLSSGETAKEGRISGELRHANSQPGAWPHPITFDIEGERIGDVAAFQLRGQIDRRQAGGRDQMTLRLEGLGVRDLVLSAEPAFPVAIDSGDMDVVAVFNTEGEHIDLSVDLGVGALAMQATTVASGVSGALLRSIAELDKLNFNIGVQGDIDKPEVSIGSDLDRVMAGVLKRELARETAALTGKIEAEVLSKTRGAFEPLSRKLTGLDTMLSQVDAKGNVVDGLLEGL